MLRRTVAAGLMVCLAAACTQKSERSPSPGRAAPGAAATGAVSSGKKNGATLRSYLAAARAVTPPIDLDKKEPATAITDPGVIRAILDLLDLDQTIKGDRKPCGFQYQLLFRGAGGRALGMVAACAPTRGKAASRATFMEPKQGVEYEITVPRARPLAALVKKKLPQAFGMGGDEAGWLRKHLEGTRPGPK